MTNFKRGLIRQTNRPMMRAANIRRPFLIDAAAALTVAAVAAVAAYTVLAALYFTLFVFWGM